MTNFYFDPLYVIILYWTDLCFIEILTNFFESVFLMTGFFSLLTSFFSVWVAFDWVEFLSLIRKIFKTWHLIDLYENIYNRVDQTTDDLANKAGNVDIIGVIWSFFFDYK